MDPILLAAIEALLTVVAEKGFDSLAPKLKRLTKKIWRKLSSHSEIISPYVEDCSPQQAPTIVQEMESLALNDAGFMRLLDKWKRNAEPVLVQNHYKATVNTTKKASINFLGINIGGSINQSNDFRG